MKVTTCRNCQKIGDSGSFLSFCKGNYLLKMQTAKLHEHSPVRAVRVGGADPISFRILVWPYTSLVLRSGLMLGDNSRAQIQS